MMALTIQFIMLLSMWVLGYIVGMNASDNKNKKD